MQCSLKSQKRQARTNHNYVQIQRHVTNKSVGKANTTNNSAGKVTLTNKSQGKVNTANQTAGKATPTNKSGGKANTTYKSSGKAHTTNKSAGKASTTNNCAGKPTLTMQSGANTNIIGPLLSGQHSLTSVERPFNLRSDLINVWRHARLVVYIFLWLMYTFASIVHSDLSDDLMFVSRSCLAFLIIPRLIKTRCHCLRLKDVVKFQGCSCSAG